MMRQTAVAFVGMFTTLLVDLGDGVMGNMTVGGYGIHEVIFDGGAKLGNLKMTGTGTILPFANYAANVRISEQPVGIGRQPE